MWFSELVRELKLLNTPSKGLKLSLFFSHVLQIMGMRLITNAKIFLKLTLLEYAVEVLGGHESNHRCTTLSKELVQHKRIGFASCSNRSLIYKIINFAIKSHNDRLNCHRRSEQIIANSFKASLASNGWVYGQYMELFTTTT
jgi:hypothetical protein